jgi:hypothetical protein
LPTLVPPNFCTITRDMTALYASPGAAARQRRRRQVPTVG